MISWRDREHKYIAKRNKIKKRNAIFATHIYKLLKVTLISFTTGLNAARVCFSHGIYLLYISELKCICLP